MITVLSTEPMAEGAQFASFRAAICSEIVDLSAHQLDRGGFKAVIRKHQVGSLGYTFVDCEPVVIERAVRNIDRDKSSCYFLALQLEGVGRVRQLGREVRLHPGDYTIFDSALPYSLHFDSPVRRLLVRLPRADFLRRGVVTENICGHAFRGDTGTSGLASRLATMLGLDADGIDQPLGNSLASAVLDAIAAAECEDPLRRQQAVNQPQAEILRRVRVIVMANLSDPDLSTERIAEMAGISVRYLHKVFSATGMTLHQWIQDERLSRCYECLTSPNQRHRTIRDIAFSNGFNDSGYFSSRFSRRYGVSPSKIRKSG